MRKLTKSEIKVLNQLYHMESMYTLQDETGLQYGELFDDLTNLISSRLIDVFDGASAVKPGFYDLDNLGDYHFRITRLGISTLINSHGT
ncbi:MAG: hypothetical protein HLUCCA01_01240 [Bacteroidetes bacterium HLUCCA01]|nr:MAG: hypothetical protein HLUCCA01_01240 [Bacteroidetes bacterium HLUCCA01]